MIIESHQLSSAQNVIKFVQTIKQPPVTNRPKRLLLKATPTSALGTHHVMFYDIITI